MKFFDLASSRCSRERVLFALKNSIPYVFLAFLCLGLFFKPVSDLDEIWNYNFARAIYNGLTPYAEFNMLPTPLASYISWFFLCVFGDNLISFRIASFVLLFAVLALVYKVALVLSGNKTLSFTFAALAFSMNFSRWIYNYNYFALMVVLAIVYLEYLRCEKQSSERSLDLNVVVGLLVGLLPLIKQSTGLVFVFINGLYCLCCVVFFKKSIRDYVWRVVLSGVPSVVYIAFLFVTNNFGNFYDYAIAGVGEFSHSITYFDYLLSSPLSFIIGVFPIVAVICLVVCFVRNKLKVGRVYALSVLLFSIGGLAVAYPLCDSQHFPVAAVSFLLVFLCCDFGFRKKLLVRFGLCISVMAAITLAAIPVVTSYSTEMVQSSLRHFERIPINKTLEGNLSSVGSWIQARENQGFKVYIADSNAAAYMIPLDRYNKDFDMLNLGNLGTQSIDDLLKDKSGSIMLVRKDECYFNYQSHVNLIRHIKENFTYLEDVAQFEAYLVPLDEIDGVYF